MRPGADQPLRRRKTRDRALILPLMGAVLFLLPVAGIPQIGARIGGIPVLVIYLFAVWALLIAGAFLLSRALRQAGSDAADGHDATGQPDGGRGDAG